MIRFFNILLIFCLFSACQQDQGTGVEQAEEPAAEKSKFSNADIIRNNLTADQPLDTSEVAKITFTDDSFDFGEISEGEKVNHEFEFINSGKVPLLISNATSTCGCTVPKWPKEPIAPGKKGKIKVAFNSDNKPGNQQKPINITANTFPSNTTIYIKGNVIPDPKKEGKRKEPKKAEDGFIFKNNPNFKDKSN